MLEQKYISGKTAVKIARSVESAVAAGKIGVGEQLPSVRDLSKHLGVAGATVAAAYRILQERGVTIGHRPRGTPPRPAPPAAGAPSWPETPIASSSPIRAATCATCASAAGFTARSSTIASS